MTHSDARTEQRAAKALPEEQPEDLGTARAMAEALLADSDERQADRDAAPAKFVEHRRSEDTTG